MKKYFKVILSAVLVGSILGFVFFYDIKKEVQAYTDESDIVYILQVGVFSNYDNAINKKNMYAVSEIFNDGEYYRVIIGVTKNNLDILKEYYKDYEFYVKEYKLDKSIVDNISKYDEAYINSTNNDVRVKILESNIELFLRNMTY